MGKIKEVLIRYKWILIGGLVVAIITGTTMANIHIFQLINYKMHANTPAIITLMEREVTGSKKQDSWYFSEGMGYLLQDMSDDSKVFFEECFEMFSEEYKESIIAAYNKRNLFFESPSKLTNILLEGLDKEAFAGYFKRMDEESVDQVLENYFGDNVILDETFVDELYKITSIYPKQLILDKFKFDIYGLLVMQEEDNKEENSTQESDIAKEIVSTEEITSTEETTIVSLRDKKNVIFSKLAPEKARDSIFNKLKVNPIQLETLKELVEFLDRNKILETRTSTVFNSLYGEISVIRKQYSEIDNQEIDLTNKKEAIELKLTEPLKEIENKNVALSSAQQEVSNVESKLQSLTGYAYMALYIEKAYGNGEYEASIPTTGWFGNYKPSSQKYIIKLTTTQFTKEGVYYVNIVEKGTKTNNKGNEYAYYVEISQDQLNQIESLKTERESKLAAVESIESEIATINSKINNIKQEGGYDELETGLKQLAAQREEYKEKVEDQAAKIQELFNIGRVIVNLEE